MLKTTHSITELLDGNIVAITSYKNHFEGYIRHALEEMNLDILYCEQEPSKEFYERYEGTLLCFHAMDVNRIYGIHRENLDHRHYRIVLLDHRCQPFGDRATSPYNADYVICNGSHKLIEDIKSISQFGERVLNVGFFTTQYACAERKDKKAFVQTVKCDYQSEFSHYRICELLLEMGYDVCSFEHVLHGTGDALPKGVRRVKPGLDYIQTLTSCSHYVGYGSSGVITNAFMPGAVQINLSTDWVSKGSPIFQKVINDLCYTARNEKDLRQLLHAPPKDDLCEYLFGKNRTNILGKIKAVIEEIASTPVANRTDAACPTKRTVGTIGKCKANGSPQSPISCRFAKYGSEGSLGSESDKRQNPV